MHPAVAPERIPAGSEGLPRKATRGTTEIPNSIIENLSLMTHAEICLALIAMRIQPNPGPRNTNPRPPAISDNTWSKWTGLTSKTKDNATRGLRNKGLEVTGEGQKALYRFDRTTWDSWVSCRPREEKAHTEVKRKAVSAKPAQQIHPECRERGCQKLCDGEKIVSIDSVTYQDLGKQVSQEILPKEQSYPPTGKPSKTSGISKTDQVQSNTSRDSGKQVSQKPIPSSSTQYPRDFQEFISVFLNLGVAMSTKDIHRCSKFFGRHSQETRLRIMQDVHGKAELWSQKEETFVPRPWNYLLQEHWDRRAATPARESQLTPREDGPTWNGKRPAWLARMPPPTIELPGGRTEINPLFTRIRDKLIEAEQSGRAAKARDPERYMLSIIENELKKPGY